MGRVDRLQDVTLPPGISMHEADGGRWKLEAVENIARFFRAHPHDFSILA